MIETLKYKFSSGAMSIIQMGEEQIGHPSTAINELVKNGYDADAGKCWVYINYQEDRSKSFLIIKDNGLGMNSETLFGNWLVTSRSSKRDEDRTLRRSAIYERRFLGSKGIGRLAAMALGRYLTIVTKQDEETEYNWLRIDRELFRGEGLLDTVSFDGGNIKSLFDIFSDIEFLKENNIEKNDELLKVLSQKPFGEFNEGTMIILQDIDGSINSIIEEEINHKNLIDTSFHKSLVDLITPLRLSDQIQSELVDLGIIKDALKLSNGTDTFELFYGINFLDEVDGKPNFLEIQPSQVISNYDYRVFGKVTDNKSVNGRYVCKRLEIDILDDDFLIEPEYLLSDEDLRQRELVKYEDIPSKYQDTNLGEFYFDIRIYDLDADSKDKMVTLLNANGRRDAIQALSRFLGLKVSKNGFGVKPYGEEEQDWLGLGAQRVKKHIVSIGPNQILGYTFLYSPQNDGLSEKTNREGFFENKEFTVFKKALTGILEEAGRRRAKYRLKHNLANIGRSIKNTLKRPDSEKFIQYLAEKSNNDPELMKLTNEFVAETNSSLDNMQDTLTLAQRLAMLGTSLELVYHELSQPISAIGGNSNLLKLKINSIDNLDIKEFLLSRVQSIELSLEAMDELKQSLQPAIGRGRKKEFKPIETFKKVLHLFRERIEQKNIIINISQSLNSISILEVEYPFWVAFLNIVNNAIYWLQFSDSKKIINFEYSESEEFVISNTGPKIKEDELEVIFEYGVTDKKVRNATGLGLSFTRNMLNDIDWGIYCENRSFGPAFYIKKNT